MRFIETTAQKKVFKLNKRIRAIAGGTSASKTISVLIYLIDDAQTDKAPTLTSVVSESFPHLRKGAMRDFLNIMKAHNYYDDDRWSKTEYTYTFESGSKLEFFSSDQASKVRGPRRDRLFVNECNNVAKEAFEQLLIRTKQYAFADWNPVTEFYMYTEYIDHREDVDFLILTYKDNEALDQNIVDEIELRKPNKQWWRVYGLGLLGEVEGKIYRDWKIIESIPHEARLERYGVDFGYSQDPTSIVAIYSYDGGYIVNEVAHQLGLSNRRIADILNNQPQALAIADSAEPKSIDELGEYGVAVLGANKGKGSVHQGIQYVQDQRMSVTKRSTNVIKSYRNYLWKVDKDGKILDVPDHYLSDPMDAVRYALESLRPRVEYDEDESTGNISNLIY